MDDSTLNIDHMTYFAALRENATKQIFVRLAYEDFEILLVHKEIHQDRIKQHTANNKSWHTAD